MAAMRIEKEGNYFGIGVVLFIVVILLWVLCFILLLYFFPDLSKSGPFGDSFGALNSLFSGLAFVGVIIAILMQKEELRLQREEVKMQRIETARLADTQEQSKKILEIQAEAMKKNAYIGALSANLDAVNKSIAEEMQRVRSVTSIGMSTGRPTMEVLTDKREKILAKLSDISSELLD